jgi:hypothetical protein
MSRSHTGSIARAMRMAVAPTVRTTCRGAFKAVAKVFYARLITTSAWKLKSSICYSECEGSIGEFRASFDAWNHHSSEFFQQGFECSI